MFGLTTLEQDPFAQGARAVEMIMERLTNDNATLDDERVTMPVQMVVRGSTTAPPGPLR